MMTKKTSWGIQAIALAFVCSFSNVATYAAPYACDLTNNSGVISFRLNEDAHNVKIITATSTNDLGQLPKGVTTTANLGIVGVFKVAVTRSAAAGYTQITSDSFQDSGIYVNKFEQPRGVVVNTNPATSSFGRIYVANGKENAITASPARTTYQGIYMINSDDTVALDTGITPRKAGITFTVGNSGSPVRVAIGKDDGLLYIGDISDPTGSLSVTDLDATGSTNVLGTVGDLTINPANNHGSIYSMIIEGNRATSNLKIWTADEDLAPTKSAWRYDVDGATLPYTGSPVGPLSTYTIAQFNSKLARGGASNYFYFCQNRNAGTDGPSLRVFNEAGTELLNSLTASRAYTGLPAGADLLRNILSVAVSPDGKTLACLRGSAFGTVLLLPITNGVPNVADGTNTAYSFSQGTGGASDNGRDIAYDAAGNLYIVNSGNEFFRIYSKGGPTIATTGSDGTFNIGVPANLVTVTSTVATIREGSGTNGVFTLSRSDVINPLTVEFTLTGTAIGGTDYATITTNVTFSVGQTNATVTVSAINNSISEFTRTVILSIAPSGNYTAGLPGSATVSILDDDPTTISLETIQPKMLEGYSASKAKFQLVRRGLLTPALTVNMSYVGSAANGTDFTGPTTVAAATNLVFVPVTLTPIDNNTYQGDRVVLLKVEAGTAYTPTTNNWANASIIDDDFPTGSPIFSDNFNTVSSDTSATWNIYSLDSFTDSHVDFGYNYTNSYVPALPGATDTLALRLRCSQNTAITNDNYDISISPQSLNLDTNDYRMSFKMWINYNGSMVNGGPGSTYHLDAGVGTTGDHANWPINGGSDGAWFAIDGDGGSTDAIGDLGAFSGNSLRAFDSGVYAAGVDTDVRMTTNPYYSLWGGLAAPAAQLAAFSSQTGTSQAGNMGVSWHTVTISKSGGIVTWHIDGVLIATINDASLAGNIFLGYHDLFKGPSPVGAMSFALVDNLKVEGYVAATPTAPKIFSVTKAGANISLMFAGSPSDTNTDFTLVSSPTLSTSSASYTPVGGAVITATNGVFQATAPAAAGNVFYRIKR